MTKELSKTMEFQSLLSYIIVGLIWSASVLLLSVLYFLFPPEIYYWNKVYDNCTTSSAKHCYVIRFIFGSYKTSFDLSKTTICIKILNPSKPIVVMEITPKQMLAHIPNCPHSPLKTVNFLLYRKEPLQDIRNVVVNHNGSGSINVTNIEIQDITENEANISYIGVAVNNLDKDKANVTQLFPSATREIRCLESGLRANACLNSMEFLIFFTIAVNLILLLTIYVIPCKEKIFCGDYREGLISSVYSGLVASTISSIVFVVLCASYRYFIKYPEYKGIQFCQYIRCLTLFLIFAVSAVIGFGGAVMAANNRKFPNENPNQLFFHEIYWMFAFALGVVIFFLFWISSLSIIAYLIGFFSEPEGPKADPKPGMNQISATQRSDHIEKGDGNDYFKDLMKGNTKVKSISQYSGTAQKSVAQSQVPNDSNPKKSVKRTESEDSTGSGYYKQLMKSQKKVKSVSQY